MPTPASQAVGDAVAAVVRGLGLKTPADADAPVVTRKRPEVQEGDPDQVVLVCVGDEEKVEPLCAGPTAGKLTYLVTRPVAVAIAWKNAGLVDDNAPLREWREAVWPAVTRKTLAAAGLARPNDVNPRPQAVFDPRALQTGFDWSVLSLDVETLEER